MKCKHCKYSKPYCLKETQEVEDCASFVPKNECVCESCENFKTKQKDKNGNCWCEEIEDRVSPDTIACEYYVPNEEERDNRPDHYIKLHGDPLDIMRQLMSQEQFEGFLWGNIIKYTLRFGRKDSKVSEAEKIVDYAQRLLNECLNQQVIDNAIKLAEREAKA